MRMWITWERHRRSVELAEAFGCEYHCIDHAGRSRLARYFLSAWETWRLLARTKPDVVFAQSPSILLSFLVAKLHVFRRFVYIIDAHNAVPNYAKKNGPLRWMTAFAVWRADYTIVTNEELVSPIEQMRGRALVLPDRTPQIPTRPMPAPFRDCPKPHFTLIASYNWDEPIDTFLEAAAGLQEPFTLFVTGKKSKAGDLLRFESERIVFADYLPDPAFEGLIAGSDLLIDLTTDDRVLVCGAYEAVAVGVPVVLVDSRVSRALFGNGAIFAKNESADYQRVLREFLSQPAYHRDRMQSFQGEFATLWNASFQPIEQAIAEVARSRQ